MYIAYHREQNSLAATEGPFISLRMCNRCSTQVVPRAHISAGNLKPAEHKRKDLLDLVSLNQVVCVCVKVLLCAQTLHQGQ